MKEEIISVLKRYDELAGLILEQTVDRYSDELYDGGSDPEEEFEKKIQALAAKATDDATYELENNPDEQLGGRSLRDVFEGMGFDELCETLEYCALNLDRGVPVSLIESLATFGDRDRILDYCSGIIGNAAWTEEELGDQDKIFEMEFQKVRAALDVLIKMEEPVFIKAILDRFMSYPQVRDFVAESIAEYITAFPAESVPMLIDELEAHTEDGMKGPCEDLVIMLSSIGKENKNDMIYDELRRAFRFMENKIYAVICLADYGDDRAVKMFKNYINRNQDTIGRELFYEMMSAIQKLGGDISDIRDPFGDFQKKYDTGE
ncbi:hypothetical protein SAMN02910456_01793 [Ruminococcaceae bacterium YRB3002]|nr:hypothetical protein SAMN02910456_01793 [Ruminococcaceae bacterium YRB3002]